MNEECESAKEEIRDKLTTRCDDDKADLKDELRNSLKSFSRKAIQDAGKVCDVKMADFKQSYLQKYQSDIQQFSEQMNKKIQTERKQM